MKTVESDTTSGQHAVQFYESDDELAAAVVPHLAEGLSAGEPIVVIATKEHRRDFESAVAARVDLAGARDGGRFFAFDAATTLESFSPDGRLDARAFEEVVGTALRTAAADGFALMGRWWAFRRLSATSRERSS
jgi:hypothetical protein